MSASLGTLPGQTPTVLLSLALLFCAGCSKDLNELDLYSQVRDFSLIDQDGTPFSRSKLDGKIWIANFFFAGCTTECSSVLQNISQLQDRLKDHPEVMLVSFTTDPRSDTPEVLREFAAPFHPAPGRWVFLTGDRKQILQTIVGDFLMPITKDYRTQADLLSGLVHSDKLALVDSSGTVRAYFDGLDPTMPDSLLKAVQQLESVTNPNP